MHDAMMSGLACMFFQDSSLLQFQKRMQDIQQANNLKNLFDVKVIPKETQMRELIDNVKSEVFSPIFKEFYLRLQRGNYLKKYTLIDRFYYVGVDGTQIFSSKKVDCKHCLRKDHANGSLTYSHQVLQAAIMHPDCKQVIPLMPQQIANKDGATKQDCEMNAAKRFLKQLRESNPRLRLIFGGDALFSKTPLIKEINADPNMTYIIVAKPGDHQFMFKFLESSCLEKKEITINGERHIYEWINGIPLTADKDAVMVNFFQYKILGKKKIKKTKKKHNENEKIKEENEKEVVLYQNSWITGLSVSEERVKILARGGRCRWKCENELFNVVKNHGYCIERNYGHGNQHLCFNFYLLTMLAFFLHQIFELTDKQYQACRIKFGSKRYMWESLRVYITVVLFNSWESLLSYSLKPPLYHYDHQIT